MFGIEHFIVFLITGLILNITPGKKAGFMSVMGIVSGAVLHTVSAALGLSIILMKSALIFNIITLLGAGYLVYLGIRIVLTKAKSTNEFKIQDKVDLKKVYSQGLLTNLLNPKVALFNLVFNVGCLFRSYGKEHKKKLVISIFREIQRCYIYCLRHKFVEIYKGLVIK